MHYKADTVLKTICCVFIFFTACNQKPNKEIWVEGYNLSSPEKFVMPESLLEISGIAFYKGNSDTVYCIQDEEGKVFKLALKMKKPSFAKFAKSGDYEDISIINENIFVLKSNGTIYRFPFIEASLNQIANSSEWKNVLPEGEYEGMYGTEVDSMLYIISKSSAVNKKSNSTTVYLLKASDSLILKETIELNIENNDKLKKNKKEFKPSGIAQHPQTKDWYIISAVNNALIVADSKWKIKDIASLSAGLFPQPEGIAFDKQGHLYISNEGGDISAATILKFNYSNKQ